MSDGKISLPGERNVINGQLSTKLNCKELAAWLEKYMLPTNNALVKLVLGFGCGTILMTFGSENPLGAKIRHGTGACTRRLNGNTIPSITSGICVWSLILMKNI